MTEVEQRKQQAKDAGYTNPMCASCAKMSKPTNKECRDCMSATPPMFTAAVKNFLTVVEGTKQ